jgi:hypothetical protein
VKQTKRPNTRRKTEKDGTTLRRRSAAVRRQLRTAGRSESKLRAAISAYCALPPSEHLPLAGDVMAAVKRTEAS